VSDCCLKPTTFQLYQTEGASKNGQSRDTGNITRAHEEDKQNITQKTKEMCNLHGPQKNKTKNNNMYEQLLIKKTI
jgi:hypothetical protein